MPAICRYWAVVSRILPLIICNPVMRCGAGNGFGGKVTYLIGSQDDLFTGLPGNRTRVSGTGCKDPSHVPNCSPPTANMSINKQPFETKAPEMALMCATRWIIFSTLTNNGVASRTPTILNHILKHRYLPRCQILPGKVHSMTSRTCCILWHIIRVYLTTTEKVERSL